MLPVSLKHTVLSPEICLGHMTGKTRNNNEIQIQLQNTTFHNHTIIQTSLCHSLDFSKKKQLQEMLFAFCHKHKKTLLIKWKGKNKAAKSVIIYTAMERMCTPMSKLCSQHLPMNYLLLRLESKKWAMLSAFKTKWHPSSDFGNVINFSKTIILLYFSCCHVYVGETKVK